MSDPLPKHQLDPDPLFLDFFHLLPDYGVPLSLQYVMEFYAGLEQGLVRNLDELFLFLRLTVVKRAEHMDAFERAFALYFFGIDIPAVAEGDPALLDTRQFQDWLREAIARGEIKGSVWQMSRAELIEKFWQTLREQLERHDGGKRWIGTGGSSPFGHSGLPQPGVRVHGPGGNRSALKAIGERNYVAYAADQSLKGTNIRQALTALKQLKPSGARSELAIDETIRQTARNGGEIELIFEQALKDKISVILLIDNGGMSMLPHVEVTRLLFGRLKDRFKELRTYFFHNTIYAQVFSDAARTDWVATEKLLQQPKDSRVIIVGDASMAPEELIDPAGSLYFYAQDALPSLHWIERLQARFRHLIWLNPLPKATWGSGYAAWTLNRIREVVEMQDLSLQGIRKAVEYLNQA